MKLDSLIVLICLTGTCAALSFAVLAEDSRSTLASAEDSPPANSAPVFNSKDELELPQQYRQWIFLSSGIDMSYSAKTDMAMHSMFDNVFVNPAAWEDFQKSGHWPDKTVLVMEGRAADSKGSINQRGHYQTQPVMGLEVHVRDNARFKDGWGFFAFDSDQAAKQIPMTASCYSCHQQHGAVDTTFVQFYPTLLPIAEKMGSFSSEYAQERKP